MEKLPVAIGEVVFLPGTPVSSISYNWLVTNKHNMAEMVTIIEIPIPVLIRNWQYI